MNVAGDSTQRWAQHFLGGGDEIRSNLVGFLKGRAWGVLSDSRRSARAAARELDPPRGVEPASAEKSLLFKMQRTELRYAFLACLEALEAKLAETFEQCYRQGLEMAEIAARAAVAPAMVYMRLFRARAGQARDALPGTRTKTRQTVSTGRASLIRGEPASQSPRTASGLILV